MVSATRAVGAETNVPLALMQWTTRIGQPLYQCQPPTGYSDKADAWVNTGALLNRLNFSLDIEDNQFGDIGLFMVGRHNVLNATACFAVSEILNLDFEVYKKSIAGFRTVDRRLQLKYDEHGIKVYDDYAHHPKEIESSLNGLKEISGTHRVISVFQPHLFSRTKDFYKDFAQKLAIADKVILMDIYPAREKPMEGVTSKLIFDELGKFSGQSEYVHDREEITNDLLKDLKDDDTIVFQGAGDVTGLCDEFIKQLKMKLN